MAKAKTASTKLNKIRDFYNKAKSSFHTKNAVASNWMNKQSLDVEDFRRKSQQLLAATSLAGQVAINMPVDQQVLQQLSFSDDGNTKLLAQVSEEETQELMNKLKATVQMAPGHLDSEQELYLEQQLSDTLGFQVTAELDGHRLNHSIGIMGGEQHLRRYPTDSLSNHDAYQEAGIAPARGAFGWFTENGELTEKAIQQEKYYFAVQTLYLPDWNSNYQDLKPWYKFRKMIVVNPAENVAVVGVVGDAGPAQWVKKQFGGSPEVIREGKIWSPASRGKILLLFVDDPEDKVPLGPIQLTDLDKQLASK